MCKSQEQWWFGGGDEDKSDDSNPGSSFDSTINSSFDSAIDSSFDSAVGSSFDSTVGSSFDSTVGSSFDSHVGSSFDSHVGSSFAKQEQAFVEGDPMRESTPTPTPHSIIDDPYVDDGTGMVGFNGGTSGDLNPVGDYEQIVDKFITRGGTRTSVPDASELAVFDNVMSDFSKEPNMYYIGDDLDLTTNDSIIQAYSTNRRGMDVLTTNQHSLPTTCLFACNMVPECGAVVARKMDDHTKCWFKNNLTTSARQASPSDQVGTFVKKNQGSVRFSYN